MRLSKEQLPQIRKACETIEKLEEYKKQLRSYIEGVASTSVKSTLARLPSFFLTHFADEEHAKRIIDSGCLDVSINEKGYVALSELNPLEFHTITQSKRKFGFAFFKDDLLKAGVELVTPIAYSKADGIVEQFKSEAPELAKKLLVEATDTQQGLSFSNMIEVRTLSNISLEHCRLFFREKDLEDSRLEKLNERAIFQLPHNASWFRDYFISGQRWVLKEEDEYIEFHDSRVDVITVQEMVSTLKQITGD